MNRVTVIIPYKEDRGWLNEAIASVPKEVQLILSQGEGNWPQNFNKALNEAKGEYIKYLHEDDMLTPNCIVDSLKCFEESGVDFIHGNAFTLLSNKQLKRWISPIPKPSLNNLLIKNTIHSATLMYHRRIFDKLGGFNEGEKYHSFEEFEFNLRCLATGFKIGYCDKFLAFYRRHERQAIKNTLGTKRRINREELVNSYL